MAKTDTLSDTSATQDTAKWNFRGTASVTERQLRCLATTGTYSGVSSTTTYDLTGSSFVVELVQRHPSTGQSQTSFFMQTTTGKNADSFIGFFVIGTGMSFREQILTMTETTATFSATDHRWLRIRSSADATSGVGTVYWETSPDGATWTNRRSITVRFALTSLYVSLDAGIWGSDGTAPNTAIFDNLNNPTTATGTITATLNRASASLSGTQVNMLSASANRQFSRKTFLGGAIGALGAGALFGSAFTASAESFGVDGLVVRDPATGNLMLNGQRFTFSGNNAPFMGLCETNSAYGAPVDADGLHLASHSEIDANLDSAQAMHATVIRAYGNVLTVGKTNAIQPTLGVFNNAGFEPTDYLLSQCAARGIKLVFPLVDNFQYYVGGKFWYCTANGVTPDSVASQFFTNTTIINSFKAHISAVLNRTNQYTGLKYKHDPTILAWETGNEMSVYPSTWTYSAWTDRISRHIRVTEGALQLVMDGCNIDTYTTASPVDTVSLSLPYTDIFTQHTYDDSRNPTTVPALATTAHSYGKAFYLGEYSWTDKDIKGFGLSWTLPQMISAVEASTYIDGDGYWALLAPLANYGGGFVLHYPGDTTDMRDRATQLTTHSLRMSSSLGA
jgi:hypothetical protein